MPATRDGLYKVEPVYEYLPGWKVPTRAVKQYQDLPPNARNYLNYLSEMVETEVGCISVGPDRDQTILVPGSRMEKLLSASVS